MLGFNLTGCDGYWSVGSSDRIDIGSGGVTADEHDPHRQNRGGWIFSETYRYLHCQPVSPIRRAPLHPGTLSVFVGSDGHLYGGPALIGNATSDEFQLLQRTVEEQKATIEQQRAEFEIRVAQQQKTLETLTATPAEGNQRPAQRVTVRMEQNRTKLPKVADAGSKRFRVPEAAAGGLRFANPSDPAEGRVLSAAASGVADDLGSRLPSVDSLLAALAIVVARGLRQPFS